MKTSTNALASREGAVRAEAKLYRIYLPGVGLFGSYPSIEAAQTALYYLPFSARKRASIHQQAGQAGPAAGCCRA